MGVNANEKLAERVVKVLIEAINNDVEGDDKVVAKI